jgi:endonuclease YncB( thermonuclease family)
MVGGCCWHGNRSNGSVVSSTITGLTAAVAVTACLAVACVNQPGGDDDTGPPTDGEVKGSVVEVIDGDTIRLDLSGAVTTVRLIGIDAPETAIASTARWRTCGSTDRCSTSASCGRDTRRPRRSNRTCAT